MEKTVLFLCTHNSCRSQIAEGLLRDMAGDKFAVYIAGVEPMLVHPLAKKVMQEIGIDISGQQSKSVDEFLDKPSLFATTLDRPARFSPGRTNYCTETYRTLQKQRERKRSNSRRSEKFETNLNHIQKLVNTRG